jgi:hypothetical protein
MIKSDHLSWCGHLLVEWISPQFFYTGWSNKNVPLVLLGTRFKVRIPITKPEPYGLIAGTFFHWAILKTTTVGFMRHTGLDKYRHLNRTTNSMTTINQLRQLPFKYWCNSYLMVGAHPPLSSFFQWDLLIWQKQILILSSAQNHQLINSTQWIFMISSNEY